MKVNGKQYNTIWVDPKDSAVIQIIDQRQLPHRFVIEDLRTVDDVVTAIKDMHVRGAPLIGVTGAFGVYLSALNLRQHEDDFDKKFVDEVERLRTARPTAINLEWAINRQLASLKGASSRDDLIQRFLKTACLLASEEIERCKNIGLHGLPILEEISHSRGQKTINILTHCNAGWLACIDYGTATAPIYEAFNRGLPIHVWVDETRPRNQGARLTAWELAQQGVPHTLIPDSAAAHLMQRGLVDMVIVGTDRTTKTGDVANKIGTYSLALAAKDNQIPFFVALPSSSIDWSLSSGIRDIPIEQRTEDEVRYVTGLNNGDPMQVLIPPAETKAVNYAFDITPARLVTSFITESGSCYPNSKEFMSLQSQ